MGDVERSSTPAPDCAAMAARISGEIWDRLYEHRDGGGEVSRCASLIGEAHESCPVCGNEASSSTNCS